MGEEDLQSDIHEHDTIIEARGVSMNFNVGRKTIHALTDIDFEAKARDFIVIYGPSGCGKSTLLNVILGLEEPTKGEVIVRNTKVYHLSDDDRAKFRVKKIGMIYQTSNWIRSLNVIENIAFPLMVEGVKEKDALVVTQHILSELGIADLAKQAPTQLSGGEQQKAGIARALVSNPHIIIADEPTGNLDSASSDDIMSLFISLNSKKKKTIILVTHNPAYWGIGTRRIEMRDGQIIKNTIHGTLET